MRDGPDAHRIHAFLAGDREAFGELVEAHQHRVYRLCFRLLGQPSLAEEAAQEVFVKVFRNLGSFRFEAQFSTWLVRIAINHCRNIQASRVRKRESSHESLDQEFPTADGGSIRRELSSPNVGPEEQLIDAERLAVVKQELMELDPMWREVLVLRDVEGQDYATIGEILDLTIGTVKSRIHRARSELGRRVRRRLRTHREPASQAGGS